MNPEQSLVAEGREGQSKPSSEPSTIVSVSDTNSLDYKEIVNQLVLLCDTNLGIASPLKVEQFFKKIKKFMTPRRIAIIYYIKMNRATTREFISFDMDIPLPTICRYIRDLLKWRIIYVSGIITRREKKGIKGGPAPEILSYDPVKPEDIARCRQRYYKECNIGVEKAKKITQLVIEEYVDYRNEVKYNDIFKKVKQEAIGFDPTPLADEVAYNLHKLEVKVWR